MANPFIHVELLTNDIAGARALYGKLFSWSYRPTSLGDGCHLVIDVGGGTGGDIPTPLAGGQTVRHLTGVVGVSNQLKLKPRVDTAHIRDDIDDALGRSWFFEPETIKVTAEGGKVRLTGTARSPSDRLPAGATAWAAPGTTSVENDIMVA